MTSQSAHALISRACTNDCVFCTVADKRRQRQFPTRAQVEGFIRERAERGVKNLVFSGLGEPTLDKAFDSYLELGASAGFERITLFTNGYRLTLDRARRYRMAGLTHVLLSMHGMEKGHDRNVQRPGSFAEASAALDHYVGVGITVTVNTVMTRHNLDEIPELRAFLRRYPIERHILSFPEWSGNALTHHDDLLSLDEVVSAAPDLIPEEDGRTYFENVPFCQVTRPIREMLGESLVQLLDGQGIKDTSSHPRRRLPERCEQASCPLLQDCPGFESAYVESRGWGDALTRIDAFIDSGAPLPKPHRARPKVEPTPTPRRISALISVPWGTWVGGEYTVSVRVQSGRHVEAAKDAYGARIRNFEADAGSADLPSVLEACAGSALRLWVRNPKVDLTPEVLELSRKARTVFVVRPDATLRRTLNLLCGLGMRVHIDPSVPVEDAAAPLRAAELYLKSPLLRVPIEPFHSLLEGLSSNVRKDLWEIAEEVPRWSYWVADDGRVSLGRRWENAEPALGEVRQGGLFVQSSVLADQVSVARRQTGSRSSSDASPCGDCPARRMCAGYFKAVAATSSCEPWKAAFERIRRVELEARELARAARA